MSLPAACAWSLATALLLAGCAHREPAAAAPPVAIPIAAQPVTIETLQLAAAAFAPDRVQVRVYLPPGYAAATGRYRVLYVNDGQDMDAVQLQPTLARLYARDAIGPVIVVAIHMLPDRMGSYGLSDRTAGRSLPANTRHGAVGTRAHEYSQWVANELVPAIDARYRTRTSPDARAVLGWSLGALNAFNLGWQYPELFGRIGAFSPSLWLSADNSDADAVQRTRLAQAMVDRSQARTGLKLFFAVGSAEETDDRDGDGSFDALDDTRDLIAGYGNADAPKARGLAQLGYSINLDHAARATRADVALLLLEGGEHNQASWARMLPAFLQWAYGRQGQATTR